MAVLKTQHRQHTVSQDWVPYEIYKKYKTQTESNTKTAENLLVVLTNEIQDGDIDHMIGYQISNGEGILKSGYTVLQFRKPIFLSREPLKTPCSWSFFTSI